jgi:formylglycine-generating enzyme required for sulfatase activity
MSGNVQEWCLNEYENPKQIGLTGKKWRTVRGLSWYYSRNDAGETIRGNFFADYRSYDVGFRLACTSPVL